MPRTNRHHFPLFEFDDENARRSDSDISSSEEEPNNQDETHSIIEDIEMETEQIGSDLYAHLTTVDDRVLAFVAAACLERMTDAGFKRFLSVHDEEFQKEAWKLWKNCMSTYSKHYVCNSCGEEIREQSECCGAIIKYIRTGAFNQLKDVVQHNIQCILNIRHRLRNQLEENHNLRGSYLEKMWRSEGKNQLKLSLIGSIDGVSLNGNTRSKLWPVTMLLVDLPTAEMQRTKNLVIHGIAEGSVNPSTKFWNTVIPMIYSDIEGLATTVDGKNVRFSISSWVADQPAKRSLFGMKAPNSEGSCFFGMCSGTHHKTLGHNRCVERGGDLTEHDAQTGSNGFGLVAPKILEFVYPYDTVIDILHTASEGIFPLIMKEAMGTSPNPRSDLFQNQQDIHIDLCEKVILPSKYLVINMTNCSEKITYFRLSFGLASLMNPTLKPQARLAICSLMLILNRMYSNAPTISDTFYAFLTGSARWALENASSSYMNTKTHELLCHLPLVIQKFGNVAPLSTFCYEHFYKYTLKGFNAQKTNNFTETAISRVILHSGVRRELQSRSLNSSSPTIKNFLAHTPELQPFKPYWKNPISELKDADRMAEVDEYEHFSTLILSIGRLQSRYRMKSGAEEIFFAMSSTGVHACYRFISACISDDDKKVLGERIRPLVSGMFPLLENVAENMDRPANTYAYNVLTQFKRYSGIVHGKPSGEMELLEFGDIKGVGGFLKCESSAYYVQLNGAGVHH